MRTGFFFVNLQSSRGRHSARHRTSTQAARQVSSDILQRKRPVGALLHVPFSDGAGMLLAPVKSRPNPLPASLRCVQTYNLIPTLKECVDPAL